MLPLRPLNQYEVVVLFRNGCHPVGLLHLLHRDTESTFNEANLPIDPSINTSAQKVSLHKLRIILNACTPYSVRSTPYGERCTTEYTLPGREPVRSTEPHCTDTVYTFGHTCRYIPPASRPNSYPASIVRTPYSWLVRYLYYVHTAVHQIYHSVPRMEYGVRSITSVVRFINTPALA